MPELLPYAPGSPDWLAARRTGVTATDIVTILGLSSWDSPYSLYWRKLGQVPEVPEVPDSDRFRLGRELEPYIVQRWGEANPDACYDAGGPALWRSTDRPWQMATPDSVLYDNEPKPVVWGQEAQPATTVGVLEVKTWADADRPAWHDGPPPAVRAQVLWQMDVMDVAVGHVGVVFLPSGEFRSYVIEHDGPMHAGFAYAAAEFGCTVCADLLVMRAAGAEFMARLRLELPAPDPDASAATLAAVKARFAKVPDKTAEIDPDLWELWVEAKYDHGLIERQIREYESKLREQAGEASVLTVDGQPVARRIVAESQVKAHVRHSDYLRRIKQEADSE